MIQITLSLIGSPNLKRDNRELKIRGYKVLALAAYLAVTRQRHSRDALAALLWPDHGQTGAKTSLRRELYRPNKAPLLPLIGVDSD